MPTFRGLSLDSSYQNIIIFIYFDFINTQNSSHDKHCRLNFYCSDNLPDLFVVICWKCTSWKNIHNVDRPNEHKSFEFLKWNQNSIWIRRTRRATTRSRKDKRHSTTESGVHFSGKPYFPFFLFPFHLKYPSVDKITINSIQNLLKYIKI